MGQTVPPALYKYGSFNQFTEDVIVNSKVWFSSSDELNDPFECRPAVNLVATPEQVERRTEELLKRQNAFLPRSERRRIARKMSRQQHPAADLSEKMREDIATRIARDVGIYCTSEDQQNILMWTHYADHHKGYCLEFDPLLDGRLHNVAQVLYQAEYPTINFFAEGASDHVDKALLTKHAGWGYEKEWRVIDVLHGKGLRQLNQTALRSITVGLGSSEKNVQLLRAWNSRRAVPVNLCRAVRDPRRFELHVERI